MRFKQYVIHEDILNMEKWTPKKWVSVYMENMFDSELDAEYSTFEEFFDYARKGAYDWAMDILSQDRWFDIGKKILKVNISSFREDRKIFNKGKGVTK